MKFHLVLGKGLVPYLHIIDATVDAGMVDVGTADVDGRLIVFHKVRRGFADFLAVEENLLPAAVVRNHHMDPGTGIEGISL